MVTETQADRLRSAIILFRFETDLIRNENGCGLAIYEGRNRHSQPATGQIKSRRYGDQGEEPIESEEVAEPWPYHRHRPTRGPYRSPRSSRRGAGMGDHVR